MTDDPLAIFRDEGQQHLQTLNRSLTTLEVAEPAQQAALLRQVIAAARALGQAAQAAGQTRIHALCQHLEAACYALQDGRLTHTPQTTDVIYDALDVIGHDLAGQAVDAALAQAVLTTLATLGDDVPIIDAGDHHPHDQDSKEMPILPDDLAVLSQDLLQQSPAAETSDSLIGIFWTEVSEHLKHLNDGLLQAEMADEAARADILREMNRIAHSMKGAARVVGFGLIEAISHYMEAALGAALDAQLRLTPNAADVLYDGLDLIQNLVDGNPNDEAIVAQVLLRLEQLVSEQARDAARLSTHEVPNAERTPAVPIPPALMTTTETGSTAPTIAMRPAEDTLRVAVRKLDQLMADTSELLIAHMQGEAHYERLLALQQAHTRWQREWRSARTAYIRLVRRMQGTNDATSADLTTLFRFLESNQRYLANATRELNQLAQVYRQDTIQLGNLTDQLQEDVANLRMMPFDTIVSGFQRMVRDLARDLEKQVHLEIAGAGVEIDKTVLDILKDPLMHLLRNAIDHGLEPPPHRQRSGKPLTGRIVLRMEQRGNQIIISVQDDGRGLDLPAIRRKAAERGILQTAELESLSDDEARLLIFQPGFTTSKTVTALSGRGLGMEIVRNRVEYLRGQVSVQSQTGVGTTVTLTVPLSLTRLRVIMLGVGDELYALPATMVTRMEIVPRSAVYTAEGQPMVTLKGQPAPLVPLARLLGLPDAADDTAHWQVMALQSGERTAAFRVDRLLREEELVLKGLGPELMNAPLVAGAAVLGTGDVIIVLDANELVRQADTSRVLPPLPRNLPRALPAHLPRSARILVVDDSITTRTLEKNILETVGYEVHVAIDGAEAWQRLSEIAPDVVITDVEMPHMTGFELTQRIKSEQTTRHIPVVLLTSLNQPEQRARGLEVGADAYLVKSRFDQGELLAVVRGLL